MIYIEKGKEPETLTAYKKQKQAYFDGCNKEDIRNNLLAEQGYLCAYCMRRINKTHMKIEHWCPECDLTTIEALDYRNMLGCCEGHIEGTKGRDDTCDTHKVRNKYESKNVDGMKKEYAGIALWYINKKLKTVEK